ncbi:hypothetical protein [Polyangium aurulentum]|uniref:hypothetical protein n=1 Tax=Polyangium aurulentum TaxID=2567896 RepID=UPI00146D617B|nr:hypothetical protein [Polyangium aurulentum]UQA54847.1 hypothetical protein E8A73_026130 [Polyangium aurulentum]
MCKRFQDCSPASIQASFGDFETCHTRYTLFCKGLLEAEGTGWTPSQAKACAESYASLDCNLYLAQPFRSTDSETPTACIPPKGARMDGAGCIDHGQCQSGHCHRAGFSLCGTCGAPGEAGTNCGANLDCKAGMVCLSGKCAAAGEAGDTCVEGLKPCNVPWTCLNGTCAKPGVLADACGTDLPPCNFLQGLYCDTAKSNQCQSATFAMAGQACQNPDMLVLCQGAGMCVQASGSCVAPSPEGGECDPVKGPGCMAPAGCLNGTCVIANSTFCP